MGAGGNEERRKLDSLRMEYQKQKETPYEVLVYESLKQKILSGGYAAGEKIPELGVSRSPLPSAIRRLGSEGLIEYYPYRGAFVKAYTDKDIHDAFAIRILLESYAISNINPEALEQERGEIEALIARCKSGDRRDEKELDVLVHETAIRLCQNAALLDIYRTLYTKIGLFRDISIADKKMSDLANRSHAVMLRSILDGNTSKALHIVKKHLQESEEKVTSYYRGSRKEGA